MIVFDFRQEKIVTDEKFFMFKEFVDIWEWDKKPGKPKANKMFYFIFLLCDLTDANHLKDIPAQGREAEAYFRVYKDKEYEFTKKEYELVTAAIDCYIKYNQTPEERILGIFDDKADEIRVALEGVMPETVENVSKDGAISFLSNSTIITKSLTDLDTIKKYKSSVISAIKKEAMTQAIRGKLALSPLSKGLISLPKYENIYSK